MFLVTGHGGACGGMTEGWSIKKQPFKDSMCSVEYRTERRFSKFIELGVFASSLNAHSIVCLMFICRILQRSEKHSLKTTRKLNISTTHI